MTTGEPCSSTRRRSCHLSGSSWNFSFVMPFQRTHCSACRHGPKISVGRFTCRSEDTASPAAQPRTGHHAGASSVHSDGSGPAQANRESRVCPLMIIAGPPSAHWKVFGRSHALRLLLLLRLLRGVSHRPAARGDILPYAGHRVAPGQRDPGQHEYCSNHTCHLTIPKKWMA